MWKKKNNKRYLFGILLALLSFGAVAQKALAAYPDRPIHLIVGFSAGGSTDSIARLVAKRLTQALGEPVVVDNRPGAGGEIALQIASKAPPDGYTLVLLTGSSATLPFVRRVPFNMDRDFTPISLVAIGPQVLVASSSVPAQNVQELIALARTKPGRLTYGTAGVGTPSNLAGLLFDLTSKVNMVQVPYNGSSEVVVATAAGDITLSFSDAVSTMPLIQAGKLHALAVTTAKRASFMPTVPTLNESGLPGFNVPLWFGISAPAGVPPQIVTELNGQLVKIFSGTDIKAPMNELGVDPAASSPAQFKAFFDQELQQNAKLIKISGMKVQ